MFAIDFFAVNQLKKSYSSACHCTQSKSIVNFFTLSQHCLLSTFSIYLLPHCTD